VRFPGSCVYLSADFWIPNRVQATMSFPIDHDRVVARFDTTVDGAHCLLDYRLTNGIVDCVMTITHTSVPEEVGHRGIASDLMKAAMDTARAEGWKVIPACSYADAWIRRHADYQGLLA
jgi:predicted GNAT family acetyltransferase